MASDTPQGGPPAVIRHIAQAMITPSYSVCQPARPLPPTPSPTSKFSTWRYRRGGSGARTGCTHLTATRLYGGDYVCEHCRRPGAFGWLYRCTEDRDALIRAGKEDGGKMTFDKLGEQLIQAVKPAFRGPEARMDKYSFLKELTPQQMATYTTSQIAIILEQRENVQKVIQQDLVKLPHMSSKRPWVPREDRECQHKVCHFCRPHYADRTHLSLNAVVNGEISPSAAVGFGFGRLGERPMADANILKNLGCHAVPLGLHKPLRHRPWSLTPSTPTSSISSLSASDLIDGQLALAAGLSAIGEDADGKVACLGGLSEEGCAAGLFLRSEPETLVCACLTELPAPTVEEDLFFAESRTIMEEVEQKKGYFGAEPLDVPQGVAVTEESIELGEADVLTQL